MDCEVTAATKFSGQLAGISRASPVQSTESVRRSTLNRPFICLILSARIPTMPANVGMVGGYGFAAFFCGNVIETIVKPDCVTDDF